VEGCGNSGVGDVLMGLFARALLWGDVDLQCGGLGRGARNADGGAIVIEVLVRVPRCGSKVFVCP
jgi:hypothetical protein